jgi:hypothetical protein
VFVAIGIQRAMGMRHTVICGLYGIFPHYLINGTISEINLWNETCVIWFSLQLLSETFIILRTNERDTIKNVYWSSCKYLLCCQGFSESLVIDYR